MKYLLSTFILLACCFQLKAQRVLPHQTAYELSIGKPLEGFDKMFQNGTFNVSAGMSYYLNSMDYVFGNFGYERQVYHYKAYQVPVQDFVLTSGYMYPLLSDEESNVFFYLGASGLVGYELVNGSQYIMPNGAKLRNESAFIYGTGLHSNLEIFLNDQLQLIFKQDFRFQWGTSLNLLRPTLSVGLKYNI